MEDKNKHSRELIEMGSPLADMPRENPHLVPDGYFREAVREVMQRIRETSGGLSDGEPREELQFLSPLLAGAERTMPFQESADPSLPWQLAAATPHNGLPDKKETIARPAPVRRLPALRVAAALLAIGTAAWLIRLQIPSAIEPAAQPTADSRSLNIDSLDHDVVEGFIRDTEILTASETIGTEIDWADEYKGIASGEPAAIDSGLSALPDASLIAFAGETAPDLHASR